MTFGRIAATAAAALLIAACGGDDDTAATTTSAAPASSSTTSTMPTTSTTEVEDALSATNPPDEITVEFVNDLLLIINGEVGAVTRAALETQTVTPEMNARLEAVATEPYAQQTLGLIVQELNGADPLVDDPGDIVMTVTRLAAVTDACIAAEVNVDSSALVAGEVPVTQAAISLVASDLDGPTAYRLDQITSVDASAEDLCS